MRGPEFSRTETIVSEGGEWAGRGTLGPRPPRLGGRGRVDRVADSNLRTAAGLRGRGKCRGRTRRWSLAWGCRKGLALATEVYRQKPAGALPARM